MNDWDDCGHHPEWVNKFDVTDTCNHPDCKVAAMNEPTLTDTEPNVIQRIVNAWDCCATCAGGILAQHVAARVAEAVDRERAAWATKVSGVIDPMGDPMDPKHLHPQAASLIFQLRGLLAADDTEGKP